MPSKRVFIVKGAKSPPRRRSPRPVVERITLDRAADIALLEVHWKRIRKLLRAPRLTAFIVATDPLDWLAFDWHLREELRELRHSVLSGTYRARGSNQIRAAKNLGLTRPTAFFSPRDTLLYRNIVALADTDLMQAMQSWTRFGRSDARNADAEVDDPQSGWFRAWLQRSGQLWTITEEYEWLVETDISNFFPSIQLDAAATHVLAHSRLSVEVVRLLSHMLREFAPVAEYRVSPVVGLPQDSFDCGRIIAHSFLQPVDEAFSVEGNEGRYSRYMDDIVIGAKTRDEGHEMIARAQRALEAIGLYPNTAKTRIVAQQDFAKELMKEENDYLGELEATRRRGEAVDGSEFASRLRAHLARDPRPRAWERVTRRYYTASRQLRSQLLWRHVGDHILELPGSTRQILDYASTFQATEGRVAAVRTAVESRDVIYEDVVLFACQYAAIVPNRRSLLVAAALREWAKSIFERNVDQRPRLAASAVVVMAKFADDTMKEFLRYAFDTRVPRDGSALRRQLAVALLGIEQMSHDEFSRLSVESDEARQMVDYVDAVNAGKDRAVGLLLGAVEPRERRDPSLYMIPPRPMLLLPTLRRSSAKKLAHARGGWRKRVTAVSPSLRDRRGEEWLGI